MFLPIEKRAHYTVIVRFYDWDLGGSDDFLGQCKLFTRNIQIDDNGMKHYPIQKDPTRLKDKRRTDFKGLFECNIDFDPMSSLPSDLGDQDYVDPAVAELLETFEPQPWYPQMGPGSRDQLASLEEKEDFAFSMIESSGLGDNQAETGFVGEEGSEAMGEI